PPFAVIGQRIEHRAVDHERARPAETVEHGLLGAREPDGTAAVRDREGVAGDRAIGAIGLVTRQIAPAGERQVLVVRAAERAEQLVALPAVAAHAAQATELTGFGAAAELAVVVEREV